MCRWLHAPGLVALSLLSALPGCRRPAFDAELGSSGLGEPGTETSASGSGPGPSTSGEPNPSTSSSSSSSTETTGEPWEPQQAIDILFIVDNSAGTAIEQTRLARALDLLGEIFTYEVPNFRIAVTTTDNGNPWCGTTTPEAGSLQMQSCVDRLDDFIDQAGSVDARERTCLNECFYGSAELGVEGAWIEGGFESGPNWNPEVPLSDVLRCVIPQGINGCGFESHLESLNKAVIRTQTEADPAFGFFRPDSVKAFVVLTDEMDCSYQSQWESIFLSTGNKAFWTDASLGYPTSGMCFNAGVDCDANGSNQECWAINKNVNGEIIGDGLDDAAVLHSPQRYADRINELTAQLHEYYPGAPVGFAIIGGFGQGGEPNFPFPQSEDDYLQYGVGPACIRQSPGFTPCNTDAQCGVLGLGACEDGYCLETEKAVSPARMLDLQKRLDSVQPYNLSSCEESYEELAFYLFELAYSI